MRTRLLLCALVSVSCVKRINPSAGEDRSSLSGVPVQFGQAMELPEGTTASWDFGDSSPGASGTQAEHAYGRSGAYTVTETIKDKDGQVRTSQTHVTVLRRSVPMSVPADVRAALLLQTPWSKIPVHREVAGKLGLGNFFDEVAHTLSDALGFDALDPAKAQENGFDPEEGLAFYTVPQDPEALIVVIGISDDAKALAAAKKLLAHGGGRFGGGPYQLTDAKLDDGTPAVLGTGPNGEKIAVIEHFGYLYLRTAGATDPLLALKSAAALPPDKGLAIDPGYLGALKHTGTGDAVFYSKAADSGRFAGEIGASSFSLNDRSELVTMRLFAQTRNLTGDQLLAAFKPAKAPPDLAAKLPAGAAGYLRISAAPQALWHELSRAAGPDAQRLRDRVQETVGLDLEKDLIPSFSGNIGIGVYLDASSLLEALFGEQVGSLDRSAFIAVAELSNPAAMQAALDKAMKGRPPTDRVELPKGSIWYRLGDGGQAALIGDTLLLAVGGPPPEEPQKAPPPKKGRKPAPPKVHEPTAAELGVLGPILLGPTAPSLSEEIYKAGIRGFEVAGLQAAWFDLAGIARSIEKEGGAHGGEMALAGALLSQRLGGLRDALIQAKAAPDGLEAEVFIRFPIPPKSAER